jgi:phosphonate transport system substrate-binding protein
VIGTKRMLLGLALIGALTGIVRGAEATESGRTYVVGIVPQRSERETLKIWAPVLREWERRTGARFVFAGARGFRGFEIDTEKGKYDFIYTNPHAALAAAARQGYIPLVCSGSERLQGVLVVRADSHWKSGADLKPGARIAFSSPNALAASLLVRAELTRRLHVAFEPVYVQTQPSVLLHVAQGLAEAGGSADSMLDQAPPEVRAQLKVIHRTIEVMPHPLMAHPGVPRRIRDAVRAVMIGLSGDEPGRTVLAAIPMPNPRSVDMAEYRELDALNLHEFMEKVD